MAFISQYNEGEDDIEIDEQTGDDLFIDLIKARPWLYDKSNSSYSDKVMIYNAWKDISVVMHETIQHCQQRWVRLKKNYCTERMAKEKESKSGSAKSKRRSWPLYEQMRKLYEREDQTRCTYSNLPSTSFESKVQVPQNCTSGKKFKNKPKKTPIVDAAFNNVNATLDSVVQFMKIKASEEKGDTPNNADKLFGLLVAAELSMMEDNEAKAKYKQIMRYLSELE